MIDSEGSCGFDFLTVSSTTVRLDKTKFNGAVRAIITCETASIRYRYDPVTADNQRADAGHILAAGGSMVLEGATNINNFRVVRSGGTDGMLRVTYEKL